MRTDKSYWQVIETEEELLELRENSKKMTLNEIAVFYGMSNSKMYTVLRHNNLKPKRVLKEKEEKKPKKDHELSSWASYENKGKIRNVYYNMLKRCYKKENRAYKHYGERGIRVCEEWLKDCSNFYRWARDNGYKENLQLDRIDVNGNYEPSNCRWITALENAYNKRCTRKITFKGLTKNLLEWEKETGIDKKILADRIFKYKWEIERALTEKPKSK